ncbi:hypothetical protein [Salinisphaera sp. LB1]|uniref:hypothetical protein n=1 Tax=Salinisphaera sp. LB1 TaxID=2183911 RepID=UPI000D70536A|nr:hypothetical protein [Salinisphaera sp. LB1]
MSKVTQTVYRWLDFDLRPPRDIPANITAPQELAFHALRISFGLIWLFNSWTASASANKHAIAQFIGVPFGAWPVRVIGNGVLLLDLILAVALLSGRGMRIALWLGVAYLLVMWVGISHTGGFNTAAGQTDPGIAPPYLIMLIITFACWRLTQPATAGHTATDEHARLAIYAMRLLFGGLWAWDALFKWHPYYLTHLVGYLTASQQGEPAWLAAYTQAWIDFITLVNPVFFAVLAALLEGILAWALITGRFLRVLMPAGFVYSLVIWSTAEGFGGPYSALGQTGMTGNMLGNAVLYALIFLTFMVVYRWPQPVEKRA